MNTKNAVLYATLPRIIPRFKSLFSSGFGYFAFLMAHIYGMVRLLPVGHPYLDPSNMGRFGVIHVITEASRHLKFSFRHLDQIIVYFALLSSITMMVAQFALVVYAMIVSPAMAFSWFDTVAPQSDIAYNLLDRVFGVPNIFCSNAAICTNYSTNATFPIPGGPSIPLPFHTALHGLFKFYSTGLLLIAVLIFLYFVVVIVAETAVSGTPFGQRFQNVWVPIRLVVALGLLMPINYGLSSGQYIVLYAAKYGSSFATNGWRVFNTAVSSHVMFSGSTQYKLIGEKYTMVALPEAPELSELLKSMATIHACAYAYHRLNGGITTTQSRDNLTTGTGKYAAYDDDYRDASGDFQIKPFLVKTPLAGLPTSSTFAGVTANPAIRLAVTSVVSPGYTNAIGFYYGSDIVIRFGEHRFTGTGDVYLDDTGGVKPLCGDIRIPVFDISNAGNGAVQGGADAMLQHYYDTVLRLWFNEDVLYLLGRGMVEYGVGKGSDAHRVICNTLQPAYFATVDACMTTQTRSLEKQSLVTKYQTGAGVGVNQAILRAWGRYIRLNTFGDMNVAVLNRGWGGAGIWYNKIAEVNSGWMDGVRGVPYMQTFPYVLEKVKKKKAQSNEGSDGDECKFTVKALSGSDSPDRAEVGYQQGDVEQISQAMCPVIDYWNRDGTDPADIVSAREGNPFIDAMHLLFGTSGLMSMRGDNVNLHPMAQLVAVGKGLVNSAVFNMAGASASAFVSGLSGQSTVGVMAEAASKIFFSMAFLGLTAGFILFYVLPFLPFIYFYFAVASWLKAIFEAMVGVPLWALAHLRIDGEGLPGDAAQNGYFLVMEIFIRPILTVAGLLAAVLIFSTQIRILNIIWDLVTANAAGFQDRPDIAGGLHATDLVLKRPVIDKFFFMIIYTIVCYMLALSSFKLIDKIPDNILRWAGAGVSSFGDIDQDQVESINRYAAMGGMTVGNQAAGAVVSLSKGTGTVLGEQLQKINTPAAQTGSGSTTGSGNQP